MTQNSWLKTQVLKSEDEARSHCSFEHGYSRATPSDHRKLYSSQQRCSNLEEEKTQNSKTQTLKLINLNKNILGSKLFTFTIFHFHHDTAVQNKPLRGRILQSCTFISSYNLCSNKLSRVIVIWWQYCHCQLSVYCVGIEPLIGSIYFYNCCFL